MTFLSADDITQGEHYTKQTEVKRWLILMLYQYAQFSIINYVRVKLQLKKNLKLSVFFC